MITPRVMLIVVGFLVMMMSIVPMLYQADISISGFSVAEKVGNSNLPQSATPYLAVIFFLGLIGVIIGCRSHNIIVH
jgi:hypothetical protein